MILSPTDEARFLAWVAVDFMHPTGCWEWTGPGDRGGYGRIRIGTLSALAHRVSYEFHVGPIPEGLQIDHLCRNRLCVRPGHLEPVTASVNTQRAHDAKGRVTHCKRGHEFTPSNTYEYGRHRHCRICKKEQMARQRAARREIA